MRNISSELLEIMTRYRCDVATALFINHFIKRTQHELKCAKRKHLELSAVEFDMDFILSEQKEIHDKYKSML